MSEHTLNDNEISVLIHAGSIPAIKLLRQRTGLDLRVAKDITDDYRFEHDLLTQTENDKRKLAVYYQLVDALKENHRQGHFLDDICREADKVMCVALGIRTRSMIALKAAGEEV